MLHIAVLVAATGTMLASNPLPPGAVARLGSAHFRHPGRIHDLAFSSDGTRLAVTDEAGMLSVWDARTGRLINRSEVGKSAAVAFGKDGKGPATFTPGFGLRVFDAAGGKVARTVESDLAAAGRNYAPGRQLAPVLAPGLGVMTYRTGEGEHCRVDAVDLGTFKTLAKFPFKHKGWESLVAFAPDGGRFVIGEATSSESALWVCDPATGKAVFEKTVEDGYPLVVSLSKGGTRVMMAVHTKQRADVRVWDIKTTKLLLDRSFPNFHFCSAALSADGATVAALDKRTISLIDVDTGKTVRTLTARFEFGRLYFSPCGKRLAVTSNGGSVEVFDLSDGSVIPPFGEVFEPDSWLRRPEDWLRFRADGKIVARLLGEPGSTVWDPLSGKRVETIETPPGARLVLQVSPDGKRLIYASGKPGNVGEFKLWDRATKTDVAVSDFPKVIWPEFDYSADGK